MKYAPKITVTKITLDHGKYTEIIFLRNKN